MEISMKLKVLMSALVLLVSSSGLQALEYDAPRVLRSGVVQELDIARYEIIISGHRYQVSRTAQVEIAGSFGAYTLLKPGMRVRFEYLRFDDGKREIFRVRELLPNETLEEA
jgi:hypothetical protein